MFFDVIPIIRELADIRVLSISCKSTARLDGKTVIITGGNSGIGRQSAIEFANRGARVIICCRNKERAENAVKDIKMLSGSKSIDYYMMDLMSFDSVRDAAAKILAHESRIDILVNNAGIVDSPRLKSVDGFESVFATNYLAHFLFTLLLVTKIKQSEIARIINISSISHRYGTIQFENFIGECSASSYISQLLSYCNSFTKELGRRLKAASIRTYCVHPGVLNTNFLNNKYLSNPFIKWMLNLYFRVFGKSVKQGCETIVHCAIEESIRDKSGFYFVNCAPVKPKKEALDKEIGKKLWDISLKMVSLQNFSVL